jgi:protease-4
MKYAVLTLSGNYAETAPLTRTLLNAGRAPTFRFDAFLARIEFLLDHKTVDTVLLDNQPDFRTSSPGALEAIRRQFERLAQAGKRIVYSAQSYDTATLFLSSACTERTIHPLGTVRFQGMARTFLFFKKLLARLGINTEIVRRGRFKSAGDRFRVESLDEYNREQHQAILDATMKDFIERVRVGFGKRTDEIEALLSGKVLGAHEAVETQWMTRAVAKNDLIEEWRKKKTREVNLSKIGVAFGKGKKVAVLIFEGIIVEGKTRQDPVMGQAIGSESFLKEIEGLRKSKSIKGVVLRINSGGGSAVASEEISAGLARLAEKKPLIVSMSEVAGSGGYWIALPGERIFAERSTITGSIGVILMLFSLRNGLKHLGITQSTIKIGEFSDLGSPFKDVSEQERSHLEREVERLYRTFLDKVASARKTTSVSIDRIAEGRIWDGDAAKKIGLVDETGGLDDALRYLQGRLKAKHLKVEFFPVIRYSFVQRLIIRNAADVKTRLMPGLDAGAVAALLPTARLRDSFLFQSSGRPIVLMPDLGEYR